MNACSSLVDLDISAAELSAFGLGKVSSNSTDAFVAFLIIIIITFIIFQV